MKPAAASRLPRPLQVVAGVVLALVLNLGLLECILLLNRAAAARAPEAVAAFRAEVLELPPIREPEPVEDVAELEEPEPLMQVDLDAPAPELEPLELPELQFDLELSLSAAPAAVQVRSSVNVHQTLEPAARPASAPREGPLDSDQVDDPPRELASSPEPAYPRSAQRRRIEGVVTIELLIDERGRVREFRNVSGEPLLVKAVEAVARDLRFTPARHGGETVAVWGRKSFRFQLPR